jgi:2-oxoglutarate ferredoxin oxidoreductase subunit alpha
MLRLKLTWPFPQKAVNELSKKVNRIIVPEMNLGQMFHPIREYADPGCEIVLSPKVGGEMHLPMELYELLEVK